MFLFIYVQPLWKILLIIFLAISLWTSVYLSFGNRSKYHLYWRILNGILLLISICAAFYVTLLSRTLGNYDISLIPFHTFRTAKDIPELYREMLMNVFLFVPSGLTIPHIWSNKRSTGEKFILSFLLLAFLSIIIEWAQYHFALGTAETDDVICNALGAFLGALPILITSKIQK